MKTANLFAEGSCLAPSREGDVRQRAVGLARAGVGAPNCCSAFTVGSGARYSQQGRRLEMGPRAKGPILRLPGLTPIGNQCCRPHKPRAEYTPNENIIHE